VFRSLFPIGLTVFDPLEDDHLVGVASVSHASARQEYTQLVEALNLPIRERAEKRKQARAEWTAASNQKPGFDHLAPGS